MAFRVNQYNATKPIWVHHWCGRHVDLSFIKYDRYLSVLHVKWLVLLPHNKSEFDSRSGWGLEFACSDRSVSGYSSVALKLWYEYLWESLVGFLSGTRAVLEVFNLRLKKSGMLGLVKWIKMKKKKKKVKKGGWSILFCIWSILFCVCCSAISTNVSKLIPTV